MILRYLLPALLVTTVAGCGEKKTDTAATSDSGKAEDKKKDDEKKKADDKSAKPKSDSAGSAAKADASAPPAASEAAVAPVASGLASLFTGEIDPSIKFERQGQVPNKPVWMQIVPYWKLNLDTPPEEEPYKNLVAMGTDEHAMIDIIVEKASASGSPGDFKGGCFAVHVADCKFDAPIDGTVGEGIKLKIAEGKGTMSTKPAKVWWMVGNIEGGDQLTVFAAVRPDVYPKLEDEMKAMLRSLKVKHG
jgi:hypothetical protein